MLKKVFSLGVLLCFFLTSLGPIPQAHAAGNELNLPVPGTMVNLSPAYEPALIKGLSVHQDNPFLFDFIVDTGNSKLTTSDPALKQEADRMIKYFFACLTIPEKDLWVNLSPYEKDRMIPQALGQTALGRDLLGQDYVLKQLTASLIYPEKGLGKDFWDRVYKKAQEMYGTSQVPVNTFNKVWVVADKAKVYEHNQTAFVVDGHLKVMLEEDYVALNKAAPSRGTSQAHSIGSQIVREVILPEIEREVNAGQNFAQLRQIFNSLILATWYKKNLKDALFTQVYADKSTVNGVDLKDPSAKEKIYQQYVQAYKKGVFNYIKEETDTAAKQSIPRKYFSGGFVANLAMIVDRSPPTGYAVSRPMNQFVRFDAVGIVNGSSRSSAQPAKNPPVVAPSAAMTIEIALPHQIDLDQEVTFTVKENVVKEGKKIEETKEVKIGLEVNENGQINLYRIMQGYSGPEHKTIYTFSQSFAGLKPIPQGQDLEEARSLIKGEHVKLSQNEDFRNRVFVTLFGKMLILKDDRKVRLLFFRTSREVVSIDFPIEGVAQGQDDENGWLFYDDIEHLAIGYRDEGNGKQMLMDLTTHGKVHSRDLRMIYNAVKSHYANAAMTASQQATMAFQPLSIDQPVTALMLEGDTDNVKEVEVVLRKRGQDFVQLMIVDAGKETVAYKGSAGDVRLYRYGPILLVYVKSKDELVFRVFKSDANKKIALLDVNDFKWAIQGDDWEIFQRIWTQKTSAIYPVGSAPSGQGGSLYVKRMVERNPLQMNMPIAVNNLLVRMNQKAREAQRTALITAVAQDKAPMDLAMAHVYGGIDLKSIGMSVAKDKDGGVKVNFDPAMIARIRKDGIQSVVPVIINMTTLPLLSVRVLLGLPGIM